MLFMIESVKKKNKRSVGIVSLKEGWEWNARRTGILKHAPALMPGAPAMAYAASA